MNNDISQKLLKRVDIFDEISYVSPFTWKDIKHLDLQDDDIITAQYEDSYYSENESWEAHYSCTISRLIEESDEEFNERILWVKQRQEESRNERYERYLKLKKEFEPTK